MIQKEPQQSKHQLTTKNLYRNVTIISIVLFVLSSLTLSSEVEYEFVLFVFTLVGGISLGLWIIRKIFLKLNLNKLYLLFLIFVIVFSAIKIGFFDFPDFDYLSENSPIKGYQKGRYVVCKTCGDIRRGDVVEYVRDTGIGRYANRIVGLQNEQVTITGKQLLVNDKPLDEPYVDWSEWPGDGADRISLGPDEYLVLPDRRLYTQNQAFEKMKLKRGMIIGKFIRKPLECLKKIILNSNFYCPGDE